MARYIDIDKLISSLKIKSQYENNQRIITTWASSLESFIDILEDTKTEDVVPVVHAHWTPDNILKTTVKVSEDGCPEDSCHCSNCGDWLTGSDEYACRGNYCPNCGAKMDEAVDYGKIH